MSNDPEQILRASMQDFGDERSSSRSSHRDEHRSHTSKYESPQHCSSGGSHNWESLMGISDHHDRHAYRKGGSIRAAAQKLKHMGRGGDTDVVHVNEKEKRVLKAMGGRGTINPKTGLKEYWPWSNGATSCDPRTWYDENRPWYNKDKPWRGESNPTNQRVQMQELKNMQNTKQMDKIEQLEEIKQLKQKLLDGNHLSRMPPTQDRSSLYKTTGVQENGTCQRFGHAHMLMNSKNPEDLEKQRELLKTLYEGFNKKNSAEKSLTDFANNQPRKSWQIKDLDQENKAVCVGTEDYLSRMGKSTRHQTFGDHIQMKVGHPAQKEYLEEKKTLEKDREDSTMNIAKALSKNKGMQLFSLGDYCYNKHDLSGRHTMCLTDFKKDPGAPAEFNLLDSNRPNIVRARMNRRGSVRVNGTGDEQDADYNFTSGPFKLYNF